MFLHSKATTTKIPKVKPDHVFQSAHKAQVTVTGDWEIQTNLTLGTNEVCKIHEASCDKSSGFQVFCDFLLFHIEDLGSSK